MRQVDFVSRWADRLADPRSAALRRDARDVLADVGRRIGVDAVVLSHAGPGDEPGWRSDGGDSPVLGLLRESRAPWMAARLRAGAEVVVDRVDGLIGAAAVDRRMLQAAGAGACLAVPVRVQHEVAAALVLVDFGGTRAWTVDEIEDARAAAVRVANTLTGGSSGALAATSEDEPPVRAEPSHRTAPAEPAPAERAAPRPHARPRLVPPVAAGRDDRDDDAPAEAGGGSATPPSRGAIRDAVFDELRDGVLVLDAEGAVVDANPAAEDVLGRSRDALVGLDLRELHAEEDREAYWQRFLGGRDGRAESLRSTVFVRPDGGRVLVEATTTGVVVDGRPLVQTTFHPLGEGATMRERLLELAYVDPVTGLGNRAALHRFLEPLVDAAHGDGTPVAVAFLDLDRFKPVNDLLGHEAGDHALRLLGGRLGASLAAGAPAGARPPQVFRLGGDEFVAVLPGADRAAARAAFARLAGDLDEPLDVDGRPVLLPASIGIAVAPEHGASARDLLRAADTAMYAAKRSPRSWVVYERSFALAEQAERDLEEGLRLAIADGAVDVGFAVQADLRDGGIDALVAVPRWPDGGGGDLDHREVLRLAERAGCAPELETLVLARALRAASAWPEGPTTPRLWLPVGGGTLSHADLRGRLRGALGQTGLDPSRITLELRNAAPLRTPAVRDGLRELRRAGVELALADRRTTFASVAAALEIGLDRVVLALDVARRTATPAGWTRLFASTARAGSRLGVPTIAGGVDDAEALEQAADLGCAVVRGAWLGEPLDVAAAWALAAALQREG